MGITSLKNYFGGATLAAHSWLCVEQCGVGGQIPLLPHPKPVLRSLNHLPGFIEFLWGSTRMQPLENGSETRVDAGNKPNQAKEGETLVLEKAFNREEP